MAGIKSYDYILALHLQISGWEGEMAGRGEASSSPGVSYANGTYPVPRKVLINAALYLGRPHSRGEVQIHRLIDVN